MASDEHLRELEEKYEGYTVYDNRGSKIGKVDDLFVDDTDNEEYIGVKMGFFGTKSTLIPTEIARINEQDRTIEVSESKDRVKDAPSFDDDDDITAEYEERIRSHFGLESLGSSDRGSYGGYSGGTTAAGTSGAGDEPTDRDARDTEPGTADHETNRETGDRDTHGETDQDRDDPGFTDRETYRDEPTTGEVTSGAGETTDREQHRDSGASTGQSETGSTTGPGQESSTAGQPTTSRQTEETETFQEGGRTKIRRRVIREEVVDADEQ